WTIARRAAQLQSARAKLVESERAAADLRAKLRYVDELPTMISYVDRDLRVRFHNRAYGEALGRAGESLVGSTLAEILGEAASGQIAPRIGEALGGTIVRFERSQR